MPNPLLPPEDPGYYYGSVLPFRQKLGADGQPVGSAEWAMPGMVRGVLDALALPGDVLSGAIDPMSPQGTERAANFGLSLGMMSRALPTGEAGALGSFTGWHGTPHLFEPEPGAPLGRFRNEAIGSGEGAQAYGWGHYVAGQKGVADSYRQTLSRPDTLFNGQSVTNLLHNTPVANFTPEQIALSSVHDNAILGATDAVQQAIRDLHDSIEGYNTVKKKNSILEPWTPLHEQEIANVRTALSWLQKNQQGFSHDSGGALLHLEVKPEEHELLDWDKPLGGQSQHVQDTLAGLGISQLDLLKHIGVSPDSVRASGPGGRFGVGADIYRMMSQAHGGGDNSARLASETLHEAGIPGLRFLDQNSRQIQQQITDAQHGLKLLQTMPPEWANTPGGKDAARNIEILQDKITNLRVKPLSHNYVIFHPDNIRITGRNGQMLDPVDHNPFHGGQ